MGQLPLLHDLLPAILLELLRILDFQSQAHRCQFLLQSFGPPLSGVAILELQLLLAHSFLNQQGSQLAADLIEPEYWHLVYHRQYLMFRRD